MRSSRLWILGGALVLTIAAGAACGGGGETAPEVKAPAQPVASEEPEPAATESAAPAPVESAAPVATEAPPAGSAEPVASEGSDEPKWKENGSVEDAIQAVPQGSPRHNLDEETLGKPLQDGEIYEPCKPSPTEHFQIKVAVYGGRAVGVDVKAKNKKLAACIEKQVRKVKWPNGVPSLNVVSYAF